MQVTGYAVFALRQIGKLDFNKTLVCYVVVLVFRPLGICLSSVVMRPEWAEKYGRNVGDREFLFQWGE